MSAPRDWIDGPQRFGHAGQISWKPATDESARRLRAQAIVCHEFAAAVRQALVEQSMNQTELGLTAGIAPETLHRRMRGESPFRLDEMLAVVDACDWADLMFIPQLREHLFET